MMNFRTTFLLQGTISKKHYVDILMHLGKTWKMILQRKSQDTLTNTVGDNYGNL